MATLLQSDEIDDNGPYIIKGFYKGDRKEYFFMLPFVLGICAYYYWKMPRPRTLDYPHNLLNWLLIAFLIVSTLCAVIAAVLRFNTQWVISRTGITRTRSSILSQREDRWSLESIAGIDVSIIGFEKGSVMYVPGRSNPPSYIIRLHLQSGKILNLKALYSRDVAARELVQIQKRLINVPCQDFRADTGNIGLGL
jgi:hypothetical protein